MYCTNCGVHNPDDSSFCMECGVLLGNAPSAGSASGAIRSANKNRTIGIATVSVVCLVVVIIAVFLFGGRGWKKTVRKFMEASLDADGEVILSLLPDEVIEAVCEEADMTERELAKYFTKKIEYSYDVYDIDTSELDWSYEIIETEYYSKKELRSLQEDYEDEDIDITLKAGKTVTIELTVCYDDDENSTEVDIGLIKVGNSWYIDVINTF